VWIAKLTGCALKKAEEQVARIIGPEPRTSGPWRIRQCGGVVLTEVIRDPVVNALSRYAQHASDLDYWDSSIGFKQRQGPSVNTDVVCLGQLTLKPSTLPPG
jgi:hypothetical protein